MKKGDKKEWAKIAIIVVVVLSFGIVHASSGQLFAGKITEAPDQEVQSLADSDYTCEPDNTTIDIDSYNGSPTAFYIPPGTESKTGNEAEEGQLVIGRYSGTTTIDCIEDYYPFDEQDFDFNTITIWANSKH